MVDRPAPQKHLASLPSLRPRHVTSYLDMHVGLVPKQRMSAPVRVERRSAHIRIDVLEPDGGIIQGDRSPKPPRQHPAGALHRRVVDHRPRQPPRLSVIRQRSEEHTSEPQSPRYLESRLRLEKKKKQI